MNCRAFVRFAAVALLASVGAASTAVAQSSFQTYRCADGTEFIVAYFQYDNRAHMQVDGKSVTLQKRVALTGSRYSGNGVTLRVTKSATTFKIGKRPVTACQST